MPTELSDLTDTWTFNARAHRVVDGDTIYFDFDCGFYITRVAPIRLYGIDTAEVYGPDAADEYERGKVHSEFTRKWLADDGGMEWPFHVTTLKETGKFGRWVGDVTRKSDGESLTTALRTAMDDV